MFTLGHFIWLGVFALIITIALILCKKYEVSKEKVNKIVLIIGLVGKIIHIGLSMIESEKGGMVIKQNQLDFHLCSIQIYLIISVYVIKNKKVTDIIKGFMVPSMVIGALLALLIPTEGVDVLRPRVWQYMIIHANLVFYGFYLMLIEKVDLSFKTYKRNLLFLIIFAYIGLNMNSILAAYGANYLYLRVPPMDNLPILNLNNGYFVYIIHLVSVAILLITLVHLPFMKKKTA